MTAAAGATQVQTITGVGASAVPGAAATVGFDFDFDFGSGITTPAFDAWLNWVPTELTLVASGVSYHGAAVDAAAYLSAHGQFYPNDGKRSAKRKVRSRNA